MVSLGPGGGGAATPFRDLASSVNPELAAEIDELRADVMGGAIVVTSESVPR